MPCPVSVSGNHFINAATNLASPAAITVVTGSDSLTFNNAISGTGSITLGGSGTLNFTASNGYTGGTTINGGQLNLSGTASLANFSTNAVVINGGTLATAAATPSIYGITVNNGGTLLPGGATLNSTGTLNVGTLSILGSSTTFGFKAANASNYDNIAVTTSNGLATNGGTVGINLYSPNGAGQFYGTGTFNLVNFAGTIQGTPPAASRCSTPCRTCRTRLASPAIISAHRHHGGPASSLERQHFPQLERCRELDQRRPQPLNLDILRFDGSWNLATYNDQSGRHVWRHALLYDRRGLYAKRQQCQPDRPHHQLFAQYPDVEPAHPVVRRHAQRGGRPDRHHGLGHPR